MSTIAIIPARGGSVGAPGKNIALLGEDPLIVWTIRAAQSSELFDRIIVSTDADDIAAVAAGEGVEIVDRPAALATSEATSADVVAHVLNAVPTSTFALLQPTSPFRNARHIREATQPVLRRSAPSVVSVSIGKPLSWAFDMIDGAELRSALSEDVVSRRQDAPTTVFPNGGIYASTTDFFVEAHALIGRGTEGFVMGQIDSLDIDEPEDLELARAVVNSGLRIIEPRSRPVG